MQDSEEGYPLHQPQDRVEKDHKLPFDNKGEPVLEKKYTPPPPVGPVHQRERVTTPVLPPHRFRNALIIGVIAGVFCVAQSIVITLSNTSTYHAFDIAKDTAVKSALAFTIFGFAALTFFISLVILCIAGFIACKVVVQRRLGFLSGLLACIIVYATCFITNYIHNYPGVQHTSKSTSNNISNGSYSVSLQLQLVWGFLCG